MLDIYDKTFKNKYSALMMYLKEANKIKFWSSKLSKYIYYIFRNRKKHIYSKLSPYHIASIEPANNFSNERIAIYTVIYGEYDSIIEPIVCPDNIDYYIITDNEIPIQSAWSKLEPKHQFDFGTNNATKNRFYKMNPHLLFKDYKYSIYIDGNIQIVTDLTEFIQSMNKYGIRVHSHYRENCVYKEIDTCIKLKKDSKDNLKKHKKHLLVQNFPKKYGMIELPVIVREHNNPLCIKIMTEWWNEFSTYSKRDQISLPYVLWKNGVNLEEINDLGKDIYSNYAFSKIKHK